jgi:trehalose 6-phosphate phosphatase
LIHSYSIMNYLYFVEGSSVLNRITQKARALVVLDYDGTLAPIVRDPKSASMPSETEQELASLCAATTVAIISGRQLSDLSPRVPKQVSFVIASHGNEGLPNIPPDANACRKICTEWVKQLRQTAAWGNPGILVERKVYTLAVHYRLTSDHVKAREMLSAVFATLAPAPRVLADKCVFDLFPPGTITKAEAVAALTKRVKPEVLLFLGDDEGDELVFASAPADWITVRVGYSRPSAAKYYLRYQREVCGLLHQLNDQLRGNGSIGISPNTT